MKVLYKIEAITHSSSVHSWKQFSLAFHSARSFPQLTLSFSLLLHVFSTSCLLTKYIFTIFLYCINEHIALLSPKEAGVQLQNFPFAPTSVCFLSCTQTPFLTSLKERFFQAKIYCPFLLCYPLSYFCWTDGCLSFAYSPPTLQPRWTSIHIAQIITSDLTN